MRVASFITIALVANVASGAITPLRRRAAVAQTNPSPITATLNSFWFDVEVQFGNETFLLLVDTGSSDTWVAKTGYKCIDPEDNLEIPQEECIWAPTYDVPTSLKYVANQTFGVQYGTGIALGRVGIQDITLGGITVGIVDRTTDKGDGINSGILGLGFPTLTSAHPGTDTANDSISLVTNRAIYEPLFVSMYKKGLVEPWYSVAIDRLPKSTSTGPGGWLGLGELPPVAHTGKWAVAPIEITKDIPDEFYQRGGAEISLMTLTVDAVSWGSSSSPTTNTTKFQAVVDTGNPNNELPREIAESINRQFQPPAVFEEEQGLYAVDCDARAPELGVTVGGQTFWHSLEDMISQDHASGLCYSTVTASSEGFGTHVNFLGDAFLKNVVSVFDFGKTEMRFAARTDADKPAPTPTPSTPAGSGGSSSALPSIPCLLLALLGATAATMFH